MKTIFEEMGGTYRQVGDYFIPSITLPDDGEYQIGKYGRMRRSYLKEYRKILYNNYVLEGTLFKHLAEIDQACNERIEKHRFRYGKAGRRLSRHAITFSNSRCVLAESSNRARASAHSSRLSFLRSGSSSSVPSSKGCSSASASSSSMSCSSFAIWHMACSDNSVSSVSVSLSARTTWFFRFFSGRSSAASSSSSQRDFHLLRHRLCNRNRPFHIHLHSQYFLHKNRHVHIVRDRRTPQTPPFENIFKKSWLLLSAPTTTTSTAACHWTVTVQCWGSVLPTAHYADISASLSCRKMQGWKPYSRKHRPLIANNAASRSQLTENGCTAHSAVPKAF